MTRRHGHSLMRSPKAVSVRHSREGGGPTYRNLGKVAYPAVIPAKAGILGRWRDVCCWGRKLETDNAKFVRSPLVRG